ncbi:MAG TPA: D-aminoacyl-tRNA deacylase [Methanomassiliicoccaceae archaeon]|nr:D-aminoacyl-tRNA deacylase [Methanomassiliicoccaceae archaeon]
MRLIICSRKDEASINIADAMLSLAEWAEEGEFKGHPVLRHGDQWLISIDELHIYAEGIDREVEDALGLEVEEIVFLSRHRAASGKPSLTVHPIGNWNKAEYGGRDGELTPAAPHLMTSLLRRMRSEAETLQYDVAFEVTHHGPLLSRPTLFIEIGSDESCWSDRDAAAALARSLLDVEVAQHPVVIGIGGGHYAPRFSEVALSRRVSFGHMLPAYAMDLTNADSIRHSIAMAMKASDTTTAYVHKKSMKRSEASMVSSLVHELGGVTVDSSDLESL